MSEIEENIKRVNTKLQQLLKNYQSLKKENEQLNSELKELKDKAAQNRQQIDELQQQAVILKSATGQMDDADKKNFERRINQYIKEIDKCIGLLSE